MKVFSIILFAVCFLSVSSATAQTKSCAKTCSKAQMEKCAKAMGMTVAECAKKCSKASAYLASSAEETVDLVPVSLTAEQKTKVAAAIQSKEISTGKSYKCKYSKASCSKSKTSANVADLKTEVKKKAARA